MNVFSIYFIFSLTDIFDIYRIKEVIIISLFFVVNKLKIHCFVL